jgi:hypothetical protein
MNVGDAIGDLTFYLLFDIAGRFCH